MVHEALGGDFGRGMIEVMGRPGLPVCVKGGADYVCKNIKNDS